MSGSRVEAKIESKKGFYLGDICYVLSQRVYYGTWGDCGGFKDGIFKDEETGYSFAVAGTAYGDGCYCDNRGGNYPVDAGVIGIVPLELVLKKNSAFQLGRVVLGAGTAEFIAEGGIIKAVFPNGEAFSIDTNED